MKKLLSAILILLIISATFTACTGEPGQNAETDAQIYTRLTEWSYHPSYSFLLTSVAEEGDSVLLRGTIARDALTPQEVEDARAKGYIEINGEIFEHTDVEPDEFMPRGGRLYSESSGTELFLIGAFFGENEGDDLRYRMTKDDENLYFHHFFKISETHLEIEVDKNMTVEIYQRVAEQMEWGTNVFFAPMEASARVFLDDTEYDTPESFPFGGSFIFMFEDGECVYLRWLP